jgi:hypothetical protein
MKISSFVSKRLVQELLLVFGEDRVRKMLGVTEARLKSLSSGRGCLSDTQLEAIHSDTGRHWVRWTIDAGGRGVTTAEGREFVASAHAMWDETLGPEKKVPTRRLKRNGTTSLRKAV